MHHKRDPGLRPVQGIQSTTYPFGTGTSNMTPPVQVGHFGLSVDADRCGRIPYGSAGDGCVQPVAVGFYVQDEGDGKNHRDGTPNNMRFISYARGFHDGRGFTFRL